MTTSRGFVPDPKIEAAVQYGYSLNLEGAWETNGQGQIIVNPPVGLTHAKRVDGLIAGIHARLPGWQVWPEVGLHTSDGVKAPDLAVAAPGFEEDTDSHGFLLRAPAICVEIMSPSNSWGEMRHKTQLYLDAGAKEVWICDEAGRLTFYTANGEQRSSTLAPSMTFDADETLL
jgi:Uma2 family endonuclease